MRNYNLWLHAWAWEWHMIGSLAYHDLTSPASLYHA